MMSVIPARAVDPTWNYAVQITASVSSAPPQITLTWLPDSSVTPLSCSVYRKSPTATSWTPLATLDGLATTYTDTTVAVGTVYEYQIIRPTSTYTAYGYISAGITLPLTDSRGTVILLVDQTYSGTLATELARLQQDLNGDGWMVSRHDVGRTDPVTSVKALVAADYAADPTHVQAVFLFGHVPVPYSGQLAPDGHPDHVGAWPADVYYGDINGNWTDSSVNYVQSLNGDPRDCARLTNVPGDGKFDQTWIPGTVQLEVGRVDFANLPGRVNGVATFKSEPELLRQYLNKDHAFRHRITPVTRRAIVGDYFGAMGGETFAAGGYRNFTPLVGGDHVTNLNAVYGDAGGVWEPTLSSNDYLLAYGCGPGTYPSIGGIGSTPDLVAADVRGVFNFLCGSWFGDWDHEDNVMRAILATTDNGLAAAWSGRPHWFIHPLGAGETIGYCARLVQNNQRQLYRNEINSAAGAVHTALIGDPTLRLLPVAPASQITGGFVGSTSTLVWMPSADAVVGYHVYRRQSPAGPFTRLTPTPLSATTFQDTTSGFGMTYMVRAVKLEITSSGTYYNASQGTFWSTPCDVTPPMVSLLAPLAGAAISGSAVTITASASDNIAVAGVQFQLDGVNLGNELLTPPYTLAWDTTTATNAPHVLTAIARDAAGNKTTSAPVSVTVSNVPPLLISGLAPAANRQPPSLKPPAYSLPPPASYSLPSAAYSVWFDDALPPGASVTSAGGDSWQWISGSPKPFAGLLAHQSALANGLHEHGFSATGGMKIAAGEMLFATVYLDPANPPSEILLSWKAEDGWEHRAYWGINKIAYGQPGTTSRRFEGKIPASGQWIVLAIPAVDVGLEGKAITGMLFSLYDGRATWDFTGKFTVAK